MALRLKQLVDGSTLVPHSTEGAAMGCSLGIEYQRKKELPKATLAPDFYGKNPATWTTMWQPAQLEGVFYTFATGYLQEMEYGSYEKKELGVYLTKIPSRRVGPQNGCHCSATVRSSEQCGR